MPISKIQQNSIADSAVHGQRNFIINGAMQVSARGTSQTGVTGAGYKQAPDRFRLEATSAGTWTVSQSTTAPEGFSNSYKFECTTANGSLSAGSKLSLVQRIEGQNLQHLKKGTSSAESITVSFWVRSSKTGTYIVQIKDQDNNRIYSQAYTILSANTWEYKTLTYAGDTTGFLDNDNSDSLRVFWWLAAGTDFSSGTLATAWESNTNANRAVGQVNLADSTSNDWYITGVQLEIGEATPFEHRSYADELQRCQRYYYQSNNGYHILTKNGYYESQSFYFPTTMRANATITYNTAPVLTGYQSSSSISYSGLSLQGRTDRFFITSSTTANSTYYNWVFNTTIKADAEL